jgi:uncharacterized coiled-coil protein SlyX
MSADYAALEARVAELEQQMRHILPQKIDAVSFGLSVLHNDVRGGFGVQGERLDRIELTLDQQGERIGRIEVTLGQQREQLDNHGLMLTEILRRLPEAGSGAPVTGS